MRKRKRGAGGAGSDKIFLKIGMTTLQRYPVGQKNLFCNFCEKLDRVLTYKNLIYLLNLQFYCVNTSYPMDNC